MKTILQPWDFNISNFYLFTNEFGIESEFEYSVAIFILALVKIHKYCVHCLSTSLTAYRRQELLVDC